MLGHGFGSWDMEDLDLCKAVVSNLVERGKEGELFLGEGWEGKFYLGALAVFEPPDKDGGGDGLHLDLGSVAGVISGGFGSWGVGELG